MKTADDTTTKDGAASTDLTGRAGKRPKPEPRAFVRPVVIAALLLFVLLAFPSIFSLYYVDAWTQVAIFSIVTLGLGLLVGRVGMVSLGQGAVLAMGAWVAARILFATALPFPVVVIAAGLITMVLGTLVGLPALRMSGLYLALITLMLAGAITVALSAINFPNGGHGFTGYNGSTVHIPAIRRPSIATADLAFFRYSVVVAILMFLLVLAHIRGKPGRAWAAIRQSESAALAAGINTTFYKLWAFALASFVTGVAGALVAGSFRYLNSLTFATEDSITLLAVVLMGGAYSLWGAIIAAILLKFLPALLNNWGVSPDWLTILFGIGVLQVLTTAPRGIDRAGAQGHCSPRPTAGRPVRPYRAGGRAGRMIDVSELTVRFGGVTPLDGMDVKFEAGTCGLIGPNGAGKTTFFNVLSGFVKPAAGGIEAFGENLLKMTHFRRARWGVRRTFQTEQAIEELSVYDNVAMVHEHSKESSGSRRQETLEAISFVGIQADPNAKVGTLGARRTQAGGGRPCGGRQAARSCCSTSPRPGCPRKRPSTSAR